MGGVSKIYKQIERIIGSKMLPDDGRLLPKHVGANT
jgi:hypothetical protein